jgi:hypothetical protein
MVKRNARVGEKEHRSRITVSSPGPEKVQGR